MMVYVPFVESVNFCDVSRISGGGDLLADDFYGCPVVPGEKKRRPLARKCAGHGTADRTSRSVNHRNLVLQQHLKVPFSICEADTMPPGKWAHRRRDSEPCRPAESYVHLTPWRARGCLIEPGLLFEAWPPFSPTDLPR